MPVSRLLRIGLAAILSLAFLAGCGDDDDSTTDDTTEDTTDESTDGTTEDTTEDTSDDTTDEGDEGTDESAEDVTEPVQVAYASFFADFDVTYLEDGDDFAEETVTDLKQRLADAGGASVDVNSVTALDDADCDAKGVNSPCAEVNYDLVVDGNPALGDQTGFAVYQSDEWKVAKTTFCTLASLGGSTPEVC